MRGFSFNRNLHIQYTSICIKKIKVISHLHITKLTINTIEHTRFKLCDTFYKLLLRQNFKIFTPFNDKLAKVFITLLAALYN